MHKYDCMTLKPSDISCVYNITLCNETRIHRSGVPDCSRAESDKQMQSYKD